MNKKTQKPMRSWLVPVEVTLRGTVVIDAPTAEAAEANLDDAIDDQFYATAELTNWDATGEVTENI